MHAVQLLPADVLYYGRELGWCIVQIKSTYHLQKHVYGDQASVIYPFETRLLCTKVVAVFLSMHYFTSFQASESTL